MSKTTQQTGNGFQEPDASEADSVVLKSKRGYLVGFIITILLGSMHVGFSMSSANQLAALFNAKYGWDTKSSQSFH